MQYTETKPNVTNAFYSKGPDYEHSAMGNITKKTEEEMKQAATFTGWDISATGEAGKTWRIYEGESMLLLTAFMTRKDNYLGEKVYNGVATGDVGTKYSAPTLTSTQAQGINWASDISIVTPKPLTLIGGVNKTYDGDATATLTADHLSGVVEGDELTVGTTSATYANKNAGTNKTVTYAGLTLSGDKAGNYSIATSGTTTGNITAKEIAATFADTSKTYDGGLAVTAGAGSLDGVIDGDTVSVTGTANFTDKNVGANKTVKYTGVALGGTDAGNYMIANTATGAGTINKATVTFTVKEGYTREYDGTTSATGAEWKITNGQIFAGDTVTGATFFFADKSVGTDKPLSISDPVIDDGNGGNNYAWGVQSGTGTITRKALSLVATPQTITEGEATPTEWSGSVTGFVTGDSLGDGDTLYFALDNPTAAAVGKYAVTGTLKVGDSDPVASGNYGDNYTFANAAANATAFTINAKYVPPTSGGGNSGGTTPATPTAPIAPAPSNPTPSNPMPNNPTPSKPATSDPTPMANAALAIVTEAEHIAATATAGMTQEMTGVANLASVENTTATNVGADNGAIAPKGQPIPKTTP